MSHTLIQIGNSKALIIPAKIIRKKNYGSKTEFDIVETNDGFRIVHRRPAVDSLDFPKVPRPTVSAKVKGLRGVVHFTHEEVEQDDRLKHILSR